MKGRSERCRAALKALAQMEPEARDCLLGRLPEPVGEIAWNTIIERKTVLLGDPSPAMPPHELDAFIAGLAGMDPRGAVALVFRGAGLRWELAEGLTGLSRKRLRNLWFERADRPVPGHREVGN